MFFSFPKARKGELTNFTANAKNFSLMAQTEPQELTHMNINAQAGRNIVGDKRIKKGHRVASGLKWESFWFC